MADEIDATRHVTRGAHRLYLAASLAVMIGEGLFAMAMLVSLARATGSALSIGVGIALSTLPPLALAPFQGAIIDWFDKVRLATWSNALRALLMAIIALAISLGYKGVVLLYGCALLCYLLWYFNVPVLESLLKVLHPGRSESGPAFVQATWLVAMLGATIVAGLFIERVGQASAFWAAVAAKGLGATLFSRLRLPSAEAPQEQLTVAALRERYTREFKAGWRYVASDHHLLLMVITAASAHPFYQALNTLIIPFASTVLKTGPVSVGLIEGAAGLGSLLAAVACVSLAKAGLEGKGLAIIEVLLVGFIMLFAATTTVREASLVYFAIGSCGCGLRVLSKSLVIQHADKAFSGRVMSTISFISLALAVCVAVLSGLLADYRTSLGYAFTAAFLLLPLGATLLWLTRPRAPDPLREEKGEVSPGTGA